MMKPRVNGKRPRPKDRLCETCGENLAAFEQALYDEYARLVGLHIRTLKAFRETGRAVDEVWRRYSAAQGRLRKKYSARPPHICGFPVRSYEEALEFEERAAVLEYSGGMPRVQAEHEAWQQLKEKGRDSGVGDSESRPFANPN